MGAQEGVLDKIDESALIAVVVIDRVEDAIPLAEALVTGGVDLMELTLRTPAALESARLIVDNVPAMTVGIGTILDPAQVSQACDTGAAFGVAPGLNSLVVERAQHEEFLFMPGIVTPSDIEQALQLNLRHLKFFPAEASGGLAYLKSIAAPYHHLGLRYIPLGGIRLNNVVKYLEEEIVLGIGGSWIAPRKQILGRQWSTITRTAQQARAAVSGFRRSLIGDVRDEK